MERIELDCLVIGAGVVGLAIARRMAMAGREVLVVEKEHLIGSQTSSRNSEVIHAGIYYPKESLKAKLCVSGKEMLYQYCQAHSVPYRRCGKIIVASEKEQISKLAQIRKQANENGVDDLKLISREELSSLEPSVSAYSALLSPSTGVVDSHSLMLQLQADFEANAGVCAFNSEVQLLRADSRGLELVLNQGEAIISAKCCINSAGLHSVPLIQRFLQSARKPMSLSSQTAWFAKGSYFSYSGKVPFSHLVYPVPEPGGLGVHLTLDMQGRAKFGPDVEWLDTHDPDKIDYTVDPEKKHKFFSEIKKYWPGVEVEKLQADYSGVRPKLSGPDSLSADFQIIGPQDHGIRGLVHLAGVESPGLTSCLAIAEHVATLVSRSNI